MITFYYRINVFFHKKFFKKYKSIYNNKSYAYRVDKINFVDIDDPFTLELSRKLIDMKIRIKMPGFELIGKSELNEVKKFLKRVMVSYLHTALIN